MTRVVVPARSGRGTARRILGTGAVAYGFYLALGDPTSPFDLATGLVSALVVAGVLGRVTFERSPSVETLGSLARSVFFLPRLLAAVVRANLALAAVVLDPRLPIDPAVVRVPAPEGTVARALLANSITLTPGTLTVDVTDDELVVHTLTAASRADLESGSLRRAVDAVCGASSSGAKVSNENDVDVGTDTGTDTRGQS
jgi:multicomponent Na+:H+ antiporter subunit E